LHPLKEDAGVTLESSPPIAVYDTLGRGEFHNKVQQEKLRRDYEHWERSKKQTKKSPVYFVYALTEPAALPIRTLNGLIDVPSDLPSGNYALVFNITEHTTRRQWMAFYPIRVR
jgi:hypothetical protein